MGWGMNPLCVHIACYNQLYGQPLPEKEATPKAPPRLKRFARSYYSPLITQKGIIFPPVEHLLDPIECLRMDP